jgi:hypothetical protein
VILLRLSPSQKKFALLISLCLLPGVLFKTCFGV